MSAAFVEFKVPAEIISALTNGSEGSQKSPGTVPRGVIFVPCSQDANVSGDFTLTVYSTIPLSWHTAPLSKLLNSKKLGLDNVEGSHISEPPNRRQHQQQREWRQRRRRRMRRRRNYEAALRQVQRKQMSTFPISMKTMSKQAPWRSERSGLFLSEDDFSGDDDSLGWNRESGERTVSMRILLVVSGRRIDDARGSNSHVNQVGERKGSGTAGLGQRRQRRWCNLGWLP